mgnify:CR=1 FL=1|jgi:hypothetical protein
MEPFRKALGWNACFKLKGRAMTVVKTRLGKV